MKLDSKQSVELALRAGIIAKLALGLTSCNTVEVARESLNDVVGAVGAVHEMLKSIEQKKG